MDFLEKPVFRIRNAFNMDPDPDFYLNAYTNPDPDPGSQNNTDPDPGQTLLSKKVGYWHEKYTLSSCLCTGGY